MRHAVEPEATGSGFQGTDGDVYADDLPESRIRQELLDQPPLPASQIDDARGVAFLQRAGDRPEPDLRQRDQRLRTGSVAIRGRRARLFRQTLQGIVRQVVPVLEIPAHDEIPTRMIFQPAFSPGDELVHLGVSDPIVFAAVQHRHQHIEMGQQVRQRLAARQCDVPVTAACVVARRQVDFIAQRFEEFAHFVPAPARQRSDAGNEGNGLPTSSGRSRHRPPKALPNTRAMATLKKDDATYGRSLT